MSRLYLRTDHALAYGRQAAALSHCRAPNETREFGWKRMDAGIGSLMRTLREARLDDRTLVVFTSDDGATFATGGYDPAFFRSNAPWRGAKKDLFESGIRVPCVARWPGHISRGQHERRAECELFPRRLEK